jgi:hypothetical protein
MSISHNKHYVNFGNGAGIWGLTGFTNGGSRPLSGRVLRPGSPGGDNGICRPGSPGGDNGICRPGAPGGDNGICRPGSPGGDNGICRPGSPAETTAFADPARRRRQRHLPRTSRRLPLRGRTHMRPGPVRVTAGPLRQALPSRRDSPSISAWARELCQLRARTACQRERPGTARSQAVLSN